MSKVVVVTPPVGRVVSSAELKEHARIDDPAEDTYLAELLDAAEDEAEDYTWRKLLTQTWDHYFDRFCDPLVLKWAPVSSLTSVTYVDSNGTTQTLASSVYELAEQDGIAIVRRKYNQSWPTARLHADSVIVRSVFGYGAAASVPPRIKRAIKMYAIWNYRYRGDEGVVFAPVREGQAETQMKMRFHGMLRPFRLARWQAIGSR